MSSELCARKWPHLWLLCFLLSLRSNMWLFAISILLCSDDRAFLRMKLRCTATALWPILSCLKAFSSVLPHKSICGPVFSKLYKSLMYFFKRCHVFKGLYCEYIKADTMPLIVNFQQLSSSLMLTLILYIPKHLEHMQFLMACGGPFKHVNARSQGSIFN